MSEPSQAVSAGAWVKQEFDGVRLGNVRRDRRLIQSAICILERPDATNPQRMDWNELRCLYRLVHTPRAQPHLLQETHRLRTAQRMLACSGRVLIIHDGTEVDFTTHPAAHQGLGPIGDGDGVGLLQNNSLAFDPDTMQVLGLIHQVVTCRQPRPANETRSQRALRPNKESRLWLDGFRGVGRAPAGVRWIDVCDRGGDYLEAMQLARQLGHEFLIRVVQNRRIQVSQMDEETGEETEQIEKLHPAIRQTKEATTKEILVASKGGRPKREILARVGYSRVVLQPPQPDGLRRGLMPLPVTLIRVWENGVDEAHAKTLAAKEKEKEMQQELQAAQQTLKAAEKAAKKARGKTAQEEARQATEAAGKAAKHAQEKWDQGKQAARQAFQEEQKHLDWWLVTNRLIKSNEEALEAVSDYEWRWPVAEEYHKVEKSGLRMERHRFRGEALLAMMAVLSVLAIRIMQMRYARDIEPDAPARTIASQEEIEMVEHASKQPRRVQTVKQFVDAVARLGGYLGRKGDGPPGWMTLWRGYQRLKDMLLGAELARSNPSLFNLLLEPSECAEATPLGTREAGTLAPP
jgi:hypothetical protein